MLSRTITLKDYGITFGQQHPLVLIAGNNVLESEETAFTTCEQLKRITQKLAIPWVFKASFDKANRSSIHSYRGLGQQKSEDLFRNIKNTFKVPILTDIHTQEQALWAASFADILQIPAFLTRQTDLLQAACKTGKVLHLKKMQMMAPQDMSHVVEKCQHFGNSQLLLCERGTLFGYHNLVVDPLGVEGLKSLGYPVVFDVTHSLQTPGKQAGSLASSKAQQTGGRGEQAPYLARSIVSLGISALFLETHPHPAQALCDGASTTPLDSVEDLLKGLLPWDQLAKQQLQSHAHTEGV